jgi:protein phosphatase
MVIELPDFSLLLLVGPSGSGKSTLAARHFAAGEIVGEPVDMGAVEARLAAREFTVVDAANIHKRDRAALCALAKRHHARAFAIVLDLPEALCRARLKGHGPPPPRVQRLKGQFAVFRAELRDIALERFKQVHRLATQEQIDAVRIERRPLAVDLRGQAGPFDIIGDVHGCADELESLLERLGYRVRKDAQNYAITPPAGRRAVFLGDLVDRGPRIADVLRIAASMVAAGSALCVLGNHEAKLIKWLAGRNVTLNFGLGESASQLGAQSAEFRAQMRAFLESLVSHYVLDQGRLVIAHAGLRESMHNRESGAVQSFALYGETSGENDDFGFPVRADWARDYRGAAKVVYGHTPMREAEWRNHTICLDTGCVFGGKLTALRYPEGELVSVNAARVYYRSVQKS